MTRQSDAIGENRRKLGEFLGALLQSAGKTKADLARETAFDRTSISHICAGRQFPEQSFWLQADRFVRANGSLIARYDSTVAAERQIRRADLENKLSELGSTGQLRTGAPLFLRDLEVYDPDAAELYADSEPIGGEFIERLHGEIRNFVNLDQQYGGTAASPLILQAYKQARHRIGTSEIRDGYTRDAYSALSEVAEVAGWSLYDSGDDGLTEQINREALEFANRAGDRSMELFIQQNQAMLAESTGRPHESINISKTILDGRLSPRLQALFRLRLARSYGRLRKETDALDQIAHARSLFQEGVRNDDPHWVWWVNEGQLSWFEGAINLDLGRNAASIDALERAANSVPEPRMNYIYRSWALYAYTVNSSWENTDRLFRDLIPHASVFRSHRAHARVIAALNIIERGFAPSSIRDLAEVMRSRLSVTA
jgi:hypothetical protein